jgi:hypothetical protein
MNNKSLSIKQSIKCSSCHKVKFRIQVRKANNIYYYGTNGDRWLNQHTCNSCKVFFKNQVKKHNKKVVIEEFEEDKLFHDKRTCRKCNGQLELDRWWNCHKCITLPSDAWDDYIYEHIDYKPSEIPLLVGGAL